MNNTRFATALHILTLLGMHKDELLSSEYIAGSINLNAAMVRKEISNLKEHGFIESKEGKGGGSALQKRADKIKLSDIYAAVRQAALLGRNNTPNPACPVGKQINERLDLLYSDAESSMLKQLSKITLAQFILQFK